MAKKAKKSTRGNRYSPQQKAEVLAYVDTFNANKGRGGAAAASRKFKVSQITIGQWLKRAGEPAPSAVGKQAALSPADFARKLERLAAVHEGIVRKEAELEALKSEYAAIKRGL
ncbi:MAG: hypothetical protein H7A51_17800 [Akkermansiaceae bacterium]|nr:hypothetical protein [Akkermansiaceae bacterium]